MSPADELVAACERLREAVRRMPDEFKEVRETCAQLGWPDPVADVLAALARLTEGGVA